VTRRDDTPEVLALQQRREFIKKAAAGSLVVAFGGMLWRVAGDDLTRKARAEMRSDGRRRLPPGQRVLDHLKPMGGQSGSGKPSEFTLRVHGEVDHPFELDYKQLLDLPQADEPADVHCVTGWSLLGVHWIGVRVSTLAEMAKVRSSARHVIFEAAHGYTSNMRLREALAPSVRVVHHFDGSPLARRNGAPVRALVPDLYFWKSAKWLTGIRFQREDEPGYWETRGYHNHADPWREERYG